jgi:hypothetical protein
MDTITIFLRAHLCPCTQEEETPHANWAQTPARNGMPASPSTPAALGIQELDTDGEWRMEIGEFEFRSPHAPSGFVVPAGTVVRRVFTDGQVQ